MAESYEEVPQGGPAQETTAPETMEAIVAAIKQSQKDEREMYDLLQKNAAAITAGREATLTDQERDFIVEEINQESEKRKNFHAVVINLSSVQTEAEKAANAALKQQADMARFLEKTLDATKEAINKASEQRHNQLKMVEINTYFGKVYESYGFIAKVVAIVALLLVVPAALGDRLPAGLVSVYNSLVMAIGGGYVAYLVYDQNYRDNQNFDEKLWPLAPTTDAELVTSNSQSIIDISGVDLPTLCAGEFCCGPGTIWNDGSGCLVDPNTAYDINA
jgi:hypothetical protein